MAIKGVQIWMMTSPTAKIIFEFHLTPVATGRPRVTKFGTYNPPKTTSYKNELRILLQNELQNRPELKDSITHLYDLPIAIDITFGMPIPKRLIKKNSEPWRHTKPMGRNDCDNLAKGVWDILNGQIFRDDGQITDARIRKLYAERPYVRISIQEDVACDVYIPEAAPL